MISCDGGDGLRLCVDAFVFGVDGLPFSVRSVMGGNGGADRHELRHPPI